MIDKIIFLDIDGVLNVIGQGYDEYGQIFHKHFEDNLRYIIEKTGAKLVITSSWRMSGMDFMLKMWKHRNLPGEIVGITPSTSHLIKNGLFDHHDDIKRGDEIKFYIDQYKIENYCIIDDDNDMLDEQMSRFVKTSDNVDHPDCVDIGYGLTFKCSENVINILNSKKIRK